MAKSILLEALQLVDEACNSKCLEEECRKLTVIANTISSTIENLPHLEPYMLKAALNTLISFLENMAADARRKGCTREALLLLEAIARLKVFL